MKKSTKKGGFEIEVVIRISGRGKIGADGMAIWYTTDGAPSQQVNWEQLITFRKCKIFFS